MSLTRPQTYFALLSWLLAVSSYGQLPLESGVEPLEHAETAPTKVAEGLSSRAEAVYSGSGELSGGERVALAGPKLSWLSDAATEPQEMTPRHLKRAREKAPGELLHQVYGIQTGANHSVAVGPYYVVQAVAGAIKTIDRDGFASSERGFGPLFGDIFPEGWAEFTSLSPQISFSREHNRFVLVAAAWDDLASDGFGMLAISRTADPFDGWWTYRIDPPGDGYFSKISAIADRWGVYVSADLSGPGETPIGSYLWSLGLGPLSGAQVNAWRSDTLTWPDGSPARGIRGAVPHTVSSENSTFFFNSRGGSGSDVLTWRLKGDRLSSPELTRTSTTVSPYHSIGDTIRQAGTTRRIRGGDTNVFHVIYAYRRLYATWSSDPLAQGDRSEVVYLKLNTDSSTVVAERKLSGGRDWYFFNPALVVNGGEGTELDVLVSYTYTHPVLAAPSTSFRLFPANGGQVDGTIDVGMYAASSQSDLASWPDRVGATYDWFDPGRAWVSYTTVNTSALDTTKIASVSLDDRPQPGGGELAPCEPDDQTACLVGSRFQLTVQWTIPDGTTGEGTATAIAGSDNSILFWFFDPSNVEILAKVLDGCGFNDHYWVFSAATTNVEYTLTAVDTFTGEAVSYTNPQGQAAPAINDTSAFACP